MAKAKRQLTEEQRQALRERLAIAREFRGQNKKAHENKEVTEPVAVQPDVQQAEPVSRDTISQTDDVDELKRQIEEMRNMVWNVMAANNSQATALVGGKLTGTSEKYPLDKKLYPDPCERLSQEPKLQRFAFPINYELKFTIGESAYTTIDNVRTKEPKFTLELIRVMMDETTGLPSNGRYTICRLTLHEDPDTALTIAREMGLAVDSENEQDFLNEMRYIRMRDWLLDCFYPPAPTPASNKRDMVIDGKLVTYWEVNEEETSSDTKIDFSKLPRVKF